MKPPSTPKPSTAEHLEWALDSIRKSDPVSASAINALETLFQAIASRKISQRDVTCQCGGTAVWDHQEKHFDCFDCNRSWPA